MLSVKCLRYPKALHITIGQLPKCRFLPPNIICKTKKNKHTRKQFFTLILVLVFLFHFNSKLYLELIHLGILATAC